MCMTVLIARKYLCHMCAVPRRSEEGTGCMFALRAVPSEAD